MLKKVTFTVVIITVLFTFTNLFSNQGGSLYCKCEAYYTSNPEGKVECKSHGWVCEGGNCWVSCDGFREDATGSGTCFSGCIW